MLALATIAMEYMNPLYYSNHTDCMYFKTSCNVAMYPRSSLAQGLGRAISWRLSWRQVLIITPTFLFGPQDWKPEELPWVEKKNGHSRIVLKISRIPRPDSSISGGAEALRRTTYFKVQMRNGNQRGLLSWLFSCRWSTCCFSSVFFKLRVYPVDNQHLSLLVYWIRQRNWIPRSVCVYHNIVIE